MSSARLRRVLAVASVAALAAVAPGCGLFGDDDAPAPTTTAVTTTTAVPAPTTELLDPGAEPRRPLRFAFPAGEVVVHISMDLSVLQDVDGSVSGVDPPAVVQVVRLATTPREGGDAAVTVTVEDVRLGGGATDEQRAALGDELAALVGLTGTGVIDDRGRVTDFSYASDGAPGGDLAPIVDGFGDQLQALVAPLPEEPVGVGARWRSTTSADVGGAAMPVSTVYELTDLTGDDLSYTSTGDGTARDLPLDPARFPGDITPHLLEVRSTSRGTGTVSLRSLAASAVVSGETTQSMRFDDADGSSTVRQQTTIDLLVIPVPADGG